MFRSSMKVQLATPITARSSVRIEVAPPRTVKIRARTCCLLMNMQQIIGPYLQ